VLNHLLGCKLDCRCLLLQVTQQHSSDKHSHQLLLLLPLSLVQVGATQLHVVLQHPSLLLNQMLLLLQLLLWPVCMLRSATSPHHAPIVHQ
jgi:hypothetical protein